MIQLPIETLETVEMLRLRVTEVETRARTYQLTCDQVIHDTRGALTLLLFYSDQLRKDTNDRHQVQKLSEKITMVGGHLSQMLGDVLSLSLWEADKPLINLSSANLKTELESLAALYQTQCEKNHLNLYLDVLETVPESLNLDIGLVRRILCNLISNAIKYSESGTIIIGASHDKEGLRITVSDEGVGIPVHCRETIFAPYERGVAGKSPQAGFGLGLSVARRFARAMGGEVVVADSEPGRGTTFSVTLPV